MYIDIRNMCIDIRNMYIDIRKSSHRSLTLHFMKPIYFKGLKELILRFIGEKKQAELAAAQEGGLTEAQYMAQR